MREDEALAESVAEGSLHLCVEGKEASQSSVLKTPSDLSTASDFEYYRSVARQGFQVAEALGYAHAQKVLHRDIKTSNLLLDLRAQFG